MIIENDKVYTFKIANGDEIIGKVVGQNETGIVLHQPLTIIPSQQGIQLVCGHLCLSMPSIVQFRF